MTVIYIESEGIQVVTGQMHKRLFRLHYNAISCYHMCLSCLCIWMCLYMCPSMYLHVYVSVWFVCVSLCESACDYICVCSCMYVCVWVCSSRCVLCSSVLRLNGKKIIRKTENSNFCLIYFYARNWNVATKLNLVYHFGTHNMYV